MNIAVTGATGFLGQYLTRELIAAGHDVVAWRRRNSGSTAPRLSASEKIKTPETIAGSGKIQWCQGTLGDPSSTDDLIAAADAVVHAAVFHHGNNFMEAPADPVEYFQINTLGSLCLLDTAARHHVRRFVFISSGAVHQRVMDNRSLDETHPLWPNSLYGSYKASVETLVHTYGFAGKLNCCSLRPTAIYGIADPLHASKWYDIVRDVADNRRVEVSGGSKEVHAADVARAVRILLETEHPIAGETFNCTDRMISRHEVANIAKRLSDSQSKIEGEPKQAQHEMDTSKIKKLGMRFGGTELLEATIRQMLIQCDLAESSTP